MSIVAVTNVEVIDFITTLKNFKDRFSAAQVEESTALLLLEQLDEFSKHVRSVYRSKEICCSPGHRTVLERKRTADQQSNENHSIEEASYKRRKENDMSTEDVYGVESAEFFPSELEKHVSSSGVSKSQLPSILCQDAYSTQYADAEENLIKQKRMRETEDVKKSCKPKVKKPGLCGISYQGQDHDDRAYSDDIKKLLKRKLPEFKNQKQLFLYMAFATLDRFYCPNCRRCNNEFSKLKEWVNQSRMAEGNFTSQSSVQTDGTPDEVPMSQSEMPRQDSVECEAINIKQVASCIEKEVNNKFADLRRLFENNLEDIAGEMLTVGIVTNRIATNPSFEAIINGFHSGLLFLSGMGQVKDRCQRFFNAFYKVGGPFTEAADNLKAQIEESLKKNFNVHFSFCV